MADRPVFVPVTSGVSLVAEIPLTFKWHPGMAPSQKKKNIFALHEAAQAIGLGPILEVSSKSGHELGRRLSAFSLMIDVSEQRMSIENAFQGSKVFEKGGPYRDLYDVSSREAKRDPRLRESGRLVAFRLQGRDFPLSPATAFYDWLYIRALYPHRKWLNLLDDCGGFSDIEFNPQRSLNCQARSCATFMSLKHRGLLDASVENFDVFRGLLQGAAL